MTSTIIRALAWLMLTLAGMPMAAAQMPVPEAGHRVTDLAQVLNVSETESLARQLEGLEARTRAQVGILIVPTLQQEPIEAFSQRVFNSWGIGRAGKNDGMLMVLSVQDRKVRIHVGRGLDGTFPERVVKRIISERMAPAFREKQYATGFSRAIDAVSGPIAEHAQVKPMPRQDSSTELQASSQGTAQPLMPSTKSGTDSSIGWGILAGGAGIACVFLVVIGLKRQAKRKAQEGAERKAAILAHEQMRQRAAKDRADALQAAQDEARRAAARAAEDRERLAAARAREERAAQNNLASARSHAAPTRSSSSYPSLHSASSSTSRPSSARSSSSSSSTSSSSSSSSTRKSVSSSSGGSARRSSATWSTYDSSPSTGSSSNSNSWSGGESSGGGGTGDF